MMSAEAFINLLIAIFTVIVNGAVTYGVVKTQLAWMRADLTRHEESLNRHQEEISRLWGRRQADRAAH
jgi:hypothetical protein